MRIRHRRGLKGRTRRLRGGDKTGLQIIGIAGGSGSGKSTFAEALKTKIETETPKKKVILISMDNYYKTLPAADRHNERGAPIDTRNEHGNPIRIYEWDEPDAVDIPLLVHHLEELRTGETVVLPTYNWKTYTSVPDSGVTITPTHDTVLIVEGLFALDKRILPILDTSYFIGRKLAYNEGQSRNNGIATMLQMNRDRRLLRNKSRYSNERYAIISKSGAQNHIDRQYMKHIYPTRKKAMITYDTNPFPPNLQATSSSPA
jgi:uridine kinase